MRTVRRISQALFFMLFLGLFLWATYPLRVFLPVDLFFRADPLVAVTAGIAARQFIARLIPGLIILAVSALLGRFFCGWICPMGFLIDVFNRMFPAASKNQHNSRLKGVKYIILAALVVTAVFSLQLTGLFDPFSILFRSTTLFLYPLFVGITEGIFGILTHITFLEDPVYSLWDSMTGSILPANTVFFTGSLLTALLFCAILLITLYQKRFWCRNLCPLGALYALVSRLRIHKRHVSDDCISCGKCRTVCRMDAISEDFKATDNAECISCMDCVAVCPVNAVKFSVKPKEKNTFRQVDMNRRRVLAAGVAGIVGASIASRAVSKPSTAGKVIRPPGAVNEPEFLDRCVRCGECVRICSTSGAGLQHALLESGLQGIWTPMLVGEMGYCEYNCNLCGQVCPTGAISPLTKEQRQEVKMGTAHFDKTRCIPWYYGEDCMVCEEHCPLPDKAIKFRTTEIVTIDGKKSTVSLPYVVEELCIGCGICVNRCPLDGNRGIFLTNANAQRE